MIIVNGKTHNPPLELKQKKLSDWLREDLMLTGTKIGCDIGVCGSCTVLVNDEAKRSCKLKMDDLDGCRIVTIEGITGQDGSLHPLQQAFIDAGAIQCGFCTPGMVLSALALLLKNHRPSRPEIRQAIKGNLCRCTGYQQIVDAVELAARAMYPAEDSKE